MDTPTPNYGILRPEEDDPMWDFEPQINQTWDKIADIPAPNSGAVLPQAGSYKVGDRFFNTATKSVYILIVKDGNWGWHWRPVQDAISPWLTVPVTAMNIAGWTFNPVVSDPFAIAFDNRGSCHWRGVIGSTPGNFARNTSHAVFKTLPIGLRPREGMSYMLGHEPLSVGLVGTNLNAWQGARVFIPHDPAANASIRGFGGTADFNLVYLTGAVSYAVGTEMYTLV